MKMIGIKDGDIYLDAAGNIAVVSDLEGLRQKIAGLLRTIKGEWVLDVTVGVPYMQEIFIVNVRESVVKIIFDKTILAVAEVKNISQSSCYLDRTSRRVQYAAVVETVYGRMEFNYNG